MNTTVNSILRKNSKIIIIHFTLENCYMKIKLVKTIDYFFYFNRN